MKREKAAVLLLRIGLAVVFLYAAGGSVLAPNNWIGYFPRFLKEMIPENILLMGFSAFELGLGLWLLSGWKQFFAGTMAAVSLVGIVIFNLGAMDVVFRDLGLVFMALALAALSPGPFET